MAREAQKKFFCLSINFRKEKNSAGQLSQEIAFRRKAASVTYEQAIQGLFTAGTSVIPDPCKTGEGMTQRKGRLQTRD